MPPPAETPPLPSGPASADQSPDSIVAEISVPVEPLPPPVLPSPEPEPFLFHGSAREYFRIWIVNTLLTLLTCGIFAAWAKVRKRRYLRGCIELMGHRFDYRASPRRILIGTCIVVILFLGYSLFGVVYPVVRVGTVLVALVLLPWIIVRSLAFNAHNTAYRGLRFRFHQPLSPAFVLYFVKPVLIILSLGFYYPAWVRARRHYAISYHRLGDAYFDFDGSSGPFYLAYLLAGILVMAAAGGGMALAITFAHFSGEKAATTLLHLLPFFLLYGLALFTAKHYLHATLFNHVWNHTRLGPHRFMARMSVPRWLGMQFTNVAAVAFSCGLLYPWAVMRSARRTAESLWFIPAGSIDKIERLGGRKGSAVGESAAEFIGLDFGL